MILFPICQRLLIFIRYDCDDSEEWINLPKQPVIVARQIVWAKMRSHPWWPAQASMCVYNCTQRCEAVDIHSYVRTFVDVGG